MTLTEKCRICDNVTGNRIIPVLEMFYGTKEKFFYLECCNCFTLQLLNIPADFSKYYQNYYSINKPQVLKPNGFKKFLRKERAKYFVNRKNLIGYLLAKTTVYPEYFNLFEKIGIKFSSKILDVGCGSGDFLLNLRKDGFNYLRGVDPYISSDLNYNGIVIKKSGLDEISEEFDYVFFNHSFEHMADPDKVLFQSRKILKNNGTLVVSMPIMNSYFWRKYENNWVQLDAPRHIFLYSIKSFNLMISKYGFNLDSIVYNAKSFSFWGSIQYMLDIPLISNKSYLVNKKKSIFSQVDIINFEKKVIELNKIGDSDTATFILRKNGK